MKKTAVKSLLVFVAVVGISLIAVGLLLVYSRPAHSLPSFNFLGGQKPEYHRKYNNQTQYRTTQDIYSFEVDFDDIFPDANKELLALGFVDKTRSESEQWHRDYLLLNGPNDRIRVRIYKRQKLSVYSTPKQSDYSSPDRYEFHVRDGWVSVTVSVDAAKWRYRLPRWLSWLL